MRAANVLFHNQMAGVLTEVEPNRTYTFDYQGYAGPPVSLTLPTSQQQYEFDAFPAFFEGLLPEGVQLEGLLKQKKIDRNDLFSQLIEVGGDMVGAVTVQEIKPNA